VTRVTGTNADGSENELTQHFIDQIVAEGRKRGETIHRNYVKS